ncbi:MAG: DUF402 domain-containing protein [Bacilli bacterium]|nr:DUF402 domain-containing protein [Bacilli bacterium]MDD4584675.1 DUF402 domain-containing protein [Bacilli bacterium]
MLNVGEDIVICSFKHNGSFHRLWEDTLLLKEDDDMFIVGNLKAKVTESDGRFWEAREPAITILFKKYWYNVICMIRSDGVHYYCNIASPSISQENSITYIDYDLDIGMSPNNNIRILDEMEYKRHSEQMEYSYELDFIIKKSMYEVISKCKKREFPFIDEIINSYYDKYLKILKEKED